MCAYYIYEELATLSEYLIWSHSWGLWCDTVNPQYSPNSHNDNIFFSQPLLVWASQEEAVLLEE